MGDYILPKEEQIALKSHLILDQNKFEMLIFTLQCVGMAKKPSHNTLFRVSEKALKMCRIKSFPVNFSSYFFSSLAVPHRRYCRIYCSKFLVQKLFNFFILFL
jgi:hypothetical protein